MSHVLIRKFNPDTDSGFIYSTWPKGLYHASSTPIKTPKAQFFKELYDQIKQHMLTSKIFIACMDEDRDTILGYSVIDRDTLQWVYVKELFRKQGLARALIKNKSNRVNVVNLTKVGNAILQKHPELEESYKKEPEENDKPST